MTKNEYPDFKELTRFFGALSSEKRICLLYDAATHNDCMHEIQESAGLSRFSVSINLKHLSKSGLIKGSLNQRNTNWCINHAELDRFKELFDNFYNEMNRNRNSEQCCTPSNRNKNGNK